MVYGQKRSTESYHVTFHDDSGIRAIGSMEAITYRDGTLCMERVSWGSRDEYDRSADGEIEIIWSFDESNTKLVMLRTGTHNAYDMMQALEERFSRYGEMACDEIVKWCNSKGIKYKFHVR